MTMWLSHNNNASSQECGYLTAMRLPHYKESASQQRGFLIKGGYLTTLKLLHNNLATYKNKNC